ncbi:DUF3027 domain-containing protein [uncultured Aurantimicrobium sp.]|uniref:DUF3027 domain-containing protein n=1 Tax=uncultured Aurantimicrobium sp. TaxID=1705357 RepID=UPI00260AD86B|nr:DUF3027 domain-containing protein [uncultured Aurantimicrobium sp.]
MSRPFPVLTAAHQSLALAALQEITTAESIGELIEETIDHDGVATLHYECKLDGYPNWVWNVSLATLEGEEPTVMEAELLPVEGALVAPEWVPWSVRLAEFLEAQKQAAAAGIVLDEELPEGLLDLAEGALDGTILDDELEDLNDSDADDSDEDDEDDEDLDDDEDDDDDDDDDDDEEDLVSAPTHSGDIDGVDIDDLDDSADADDED